VGGYLQTLLRTSLSLSCTRAQKDFYKKNNKILYKKKSNLEEFSKKKNKKTKTSVRKDDRIFVFVCFCFCLGGGLTN